MIKLGAWVRMKTPRQSVGDGRVGRVIAITIVEDFDGKRKSYHVRWLGDDAEPDADTVELHADEIETLEEDN